LQVLASLWGESLAPGTSPQALSPDGIAAAADAKGLQATERTIDWQGLLAVDVPVLVQMMANDLNGQDWHLLLAAGSDEVLLLSDGQRLSMARPEFDRRWLGKALFLWKDYDHILDAPSAASELLSRLGFVSQDPAASIAAFQKARGLPETGQMDPLTAVRIYAEAYPTRVPRLLWTEGAP
jgi:hypothetical protein